MEIQREILRLKDNSIQDAVATGTGFVRDIGDDPVFTMKFGTSQLWLPQAESPL